MPHMSMNLLHALALGLTTVAEWTLKHYYNGRKYVKSSLTTGNFYFSSDSSGNVILKQYEDSSSPSYLSFIVLEKGADDVRYKIHLPKNPSGEDWYLTNSKKDVKYEQLNSIDGIVRRGDLFSIFEVRNSAASCKGTGWMKREDNQQKYYLE
ncbi:hypothetical protein FSP39_013534 [Pinctada imbricata]|uniref:Uncharacterized protein n=1 Tax=Pinctada imbricata TaxID=66713 RepID=A0AA88Y8G3_PINIB|nr:hypothetical protein FSP39_013534 [Pinctada imbricata]